MSARTYDGDHLETQNYNEFMCASARGHLDSGIVLGMRRVGAALTNGVEVHDFS